MKFSVSAPSNEHMSESKRWLEHLAKLDPGKFLEESSIPRNETTASVEGLYCLGFLNRQITVYSQQIRAINLIHALAKLSKNAAGDAKPDLGEKLVAVVGAGFAGLTAAAFAAEVGANVHLIEAATRPLWIQDHCENRWIHPRIYDWPQPGALEPATTLPILNWRAGTAREVAAQVRRQWDRLVATNQRLRQFFGWRVFDISSGPNGRGARLALTPQGPDTADSATIEEVTRTTFDYVILAIGFGAEGEHGIGEGEHGIGTSYWNDADGLDWMKPGAKVLISGYGDGGLADLLRLCLRDFQHDQICNVVHDVVVDKNSPLLEWESQNIKNPKDLDKMYRNLDHPKVRKRLQELFTDRYDVALAGRGWLYGAQSAIINRFLVSQLRKPNGEAAFREIEGSIAEKNDKSLRIEPKSPGYRVWFDYHEGIQKDKSFEDFDYVLIRHGPTPVHGEIGALQKWSGLSARKKFWRELPQALDQTRVSIWCDERIETIASGPLARLPFYESCADLWCLVLHPESVNTTWSQVATLAIRELRDKNPDKQIPGVRSINPTPLVLKAEEAVENPKSYRQTVRALCRADIMIADVTGTDPAMMLLLGIRSAVRPGVTIACFGQELTPKVWSALPFNLKELNLISTATKERKHRVAEAIEDGLRQLAESASYLDLPAYDYVRNLGRSSQAYEQIPFEKRILLLRPFGQPYDPDNLEWVQACTEAALKDHKAKENKAKKDKAREDWTPRIESIIDQVSPRLVGQRLYEAIRRSDMCIADWTLWRANVLYECGVRLAVNSVAPVLLLDQTRPPPDHYSKDVMEALKKLFRPVEYTRQDEEPFRKAIEQFFLKRDKPIQSTDSALGHDDTLRMATRCFATRQESFLIPVHSALEAAVTASVGAGDALQKVDPTQLYAQENASFSDEIRESVLEHRCAAWCYLDDREAPYEFRPEELLDPDKRVIFREYRKLGTILTNILERRCGGSDPQILAGIRSRDSRILLRIGERDNEMETLKEFDDLLSAWERARKRLNEVRSYEPDKEEIDELSGLNEQLGTLECELNRLNPRVVQMLRQAVQIGACEIERLKQASEAKKG